MSIVLLFLPVLPQHMYYLVPLTVLTLTVPHVILMYNIIKKNHLLFILKREEDKLDKVAHLEIDAENVQTEEEETETESRCEDFPRKNLANKTELLNQEQFEAYFEQKKPYLNPNFKITDLIEPLNVNRSYISAFINKTYNMNFSRYVNISRLKELETLMQSPDNKGKDAIDLTTKAGFGSYRNYLRTKKKEKAIMEDKD